MANSSEIARADNPKKPGPQEEVGERAALVLAQETPAQLAADAAALTRLAHRHLDAGPAAEVLAMLGVGPDVPAEPAEPDGEEPAPEEPAPATPLPPISHGTRSGYEQHRQRGDMPACRPCREATAAYQRSRDAARRATGGAQ